MDRLRRVASLWSWLPAFRAVAESQHLPTASRQLFVSASALSRTIRLLEDDLGQPLFLRHGRRIELNEAGERLLVAIRNAMRLVHEGIAGLSDATLSGPVFISSFGLATDALLMSAFKALRREHPLLVPHVVPPVSHPVKNALLRGQVDVALVPEPIRDTQIVSLHLGELACGVYCAQGHPLFGADNVEEHDVLAHRFVTIGDGAASENWPGRLERDIALVVADQSLKIEACAQGDLLAVLPDAAAQVLPGGAQLRRVPIELVEPSQIFALHRHTLVSGGRAETVVQAIRSLIPRSG